MLLAAPNATRNEFRPHRKGLNVNTRACLRLCPFDGHTSHVDLQASTKPSLSAVVVPDSSDCSKAARQWLLSKVSRSGLCSCSRPHLCAARFATAILRQVVFALATCGTAVGQPGFIVSPHADAEHEVFTTPHRHDPLSRLVPSCFRNSFSALSQFFVLVGLSVPDRKIAHDEVALDVFGARHI